MKKRTKTILLVITSFVLLYIVLVPINLYRVSKGKRPILSYQSNGILYSDAEDVEDTNFVPMETKEYTAYSMLGYQIIKCDKCTNQTYIIPFGKGNLPNDYLFCKKDDVEVNYSFKEGILEVISTSEEINKKDVKLSKEGNVIDPSLDIFNELEGCHGQYYEKLDKNYTLSKVCNINHMKDEDILNVYESKKEDLIKTKKEIMKKHEELNEFICN